MTVLENLQMGATGRRAGEFDRDLERVLRCFRDCSSACNQRGGTFSGGEQQMLAIARALMAGRGCFCSTSLRSALLR